MECGSSLAGFFSTKVEGIRQKIPYYYLKGIQGSQGHKQKTIWVEAALHGDEYDGIITVMHLREELKPEELYGNVLLVPILNVSAYEGQANGSPVDGVNLNRVFDREQPGDSFSYKYGEFILGMILGIADYVVDLHGGGQYLDVDAAIYAVLHSGESYSTYSNPDVDAMLDEARSCRDEEKRNELYAEIQNTVIEDRLINVEAIQNGKKRA